MSWTTVNLRPTGETGYATFFEHPNDGSAVVSVMTKAYIMRVLPLGNIMLAQQLHVPSPDPNEKSVEAIVQFTHDSFIKMGYKDRQPHAVEIVDHLYDFDEKEFAKHPTDAQKAIIEIRKHYNLMGGAFLTPSYPDLIPVGFLPPPPIPFMPLPGSPI